jgi:putative ABC transport system ATP-binding protein/lipoprotein-releasing system ATP-binding protein
MGIIAKNIKKTIGSPPINILNNINLEIHDADFIALTGRSGSGKSSLLYLLSTLDTPSTGSITIDDNNVTAMNKEQIAAFRNEKMGFVFQFHYLISELTAIENVLLPTMKTKIDVSKKEYATHLLEQFDLKDKMKRLPRQLSGGELQRVAIARSLIMQPKYLFADEPTGSLDSVNGEHIMQILANLNKNSSTTIILVTHDIDFAKYAKKQITLSDGAIIN